jgi:hypothetical protein
MISVTEIQRIFKEVILWRIIQNPERVSKPAPPEYVSETYLKQKFYQSTLKLLFLSHNR